jgi:hypothetical protein
MAENGSSHKIQAGLKEEKEAESISRFLFHLALLKEL